MSKTAIQQAHQALVAGNERFRDGGASGRQFNVDVHAQLKPQRPKVAILGCADSRVPVELVFDQDVGELFVVRVAGNIAQAGQLASLEYAVTQLGVCLIVVLGHTECGAVAVAVEQMREGGTSGSEHVDALVDLLRPGLEGVNLCSHSAVADGVRSNVVATSTALQRDSKLLQAAIDAGELHITGAEYDLDSGVVDFFHQVP